MFLKSAVLCLAMNIYYEANTEPILGKFAVAHVTLNRVKSENYHNTVCQVVYEKSQFSWTLYRQKLPSGKGWEQSKKIATLVLNNESFNKTDPTKGSIYYHRYDIKPSWANERYFTIKIGKHIFYNKV